MASDWISTGACLPLSTKGRGLVCGARSVEKWELIDLYAGERRMPTAERMASSEQFESYRWRKYMNYIWLKRNAKHRKRYGAWLCKDWNSRHENSEKLEAFNMYFIKERTQPPGREPTMSTHRLLRYHCRSATLLNKQPLEKALKSQASESMIKTLNIR